ncbi:MAG: DUF5652 family protein [Patescibacteria group bacterium]|nr:DUF5652 family protein [bacterium]MDZ4240990.1 DUF5652 family protein [Patescibacteria group bacterium]
MDEGFRIFIEQNAGLISFVLILITILKGLALWKAAQLNQKWWFIAILFINSLGILEIVYLLLISKKYTVEIKEG